MEFTDGSYGGLELSSNADALTPKAAFVFANAWRERNDRTFGRIPDIVQSPIYPYWVKIVASLQYPLLRVLKKKKRAVSSTRFVGKVVA